MIIPVLLLISFGTLVIYTSEPQQALAQAIFAIIGLGGFFLLSNFDYRMFKPLNRVIYFSILFLLVVVFLIGFETRGSLRWISLGPFNLQPSEFAKISLILCLAEFWSNNSPNWKNIAKSLVILLPFTLLIFRQPDLGTALTLGFIWLSLLIATNVSLIKLAVIFILNFILAPLGWLFLKSYQKQRLISFIFPGQDPLGVGYNVIQSTIAVGSGEIFGRGLGRGTQSRLQFLPEFRTDFIFAFIAEELGLIGSAIVLGLYLAIFYFCFKILINTKEQFGDLLVIGIVSMLFFQVFVNIGMNTGILPITGITLPLLSYGGSSIITTLLSLGIVSSVKKFGLKRKEIDTFSI
ncbi:rod shape-determining protein RodA [Candidatus Daviesbacteria bacterium]|nr:rod shape-determining protein RodA [Candidatus Daviesbacteria bacterium]